MYSFYDEVSKDSYSEADNSFNLQVQRSFSSSVKKSNDSLLLKKKKQRSNNLNNPFSSIEHANSDLLHFDYTIMVVDDEHLIRISTGKIISQFFQMNGKTTKIIEACDGLEGLYKYYEILKLNQKIDFIFSDETMNFMSGSFMINILRNALKLNETKYYIVTSYENFKASKDIDGLIKKPISTNSLKETISI